MDASPSGLTGPINARVEGAPSARRSGPQRPATFPTLGAALDWVLRMFERHDLVTGWLSSPGPPWRAVHVIRIREGQLLLVGNTCPERGPAAKWEPDPVAERSVAQLLPARGYHRLDLPEPGTPLETLRPLLPTRVFNCLDRQGYHTVEQVSVLPDLAFLDMTNMGTGSIAQVRTAIAALSTSSPAAAAAVTLTLDRAGHLATLLAELAELARAHDAPELAERADIFRHRLSP